MKQNITTFKTCLLLAGSLALASSCQDYEPFSEQQVQDVAYTREFTRQFGDIDPNQDWDLFGQLTRGIGPTTRGAATQVTSRWTSETVTFSPTEIATYKQVLPESETAQRALAETNLGQVTQNFTTTARTLKLAPVYSVSSSKGKDEIGIYWYVQPGAASDVDQYGDKVETLTVMVDDGNGGVTARYIQRVPIIRSGPEHSSESFVNHMRENSDGSVTSNICEVTIPASITSYGFYITNHSYDGSTTPKTKYSESALNTKVPEYGDIDVSWAATFNLKELGLSETDDQQYLCFEDWMNQNNFDLNDVVFGIKDFDPSTIIDHDAENEKAILVCEDLNNYDFDFNDVVLGLNYKEEAEYEWVPKPNPEGEGTYKERILVPGSEKRSLTITPMAAGGAFESTVAFGLTTETTLGRIHALMGEDPVIESATGHNPLNPIFNATDEYKGDGTSTTFEGDDLPAKGSDVGIGEGFAYPTFLSKLFAQGYFKIYCTQGRSSGNVQARLLTNKTQTETDTYYDDETNTGFAQAPQMMLLPYYFEWPQENKWIQDAYTGFADWVSDASKTDWIKTGQDKNLIVERGDFIEESTNPTVDPGNIKEEFNINVEQPKKFKYNETTTYNNGVFVPIGDDVLINEGATAELKVTFLYKPANTFYFDDADGNELFKDQSGMNNLYKSDGSLITTSVGTNYSQFNETWFPWGQFTPITITYPMTAEETSMAVNSGGIWILCADDYAFKIQEVALLTVTGVTDPTTVHNLTVNPTSLTFASSEAEGQTITATCTTISNLSAITFVSSDETVATVSANSNGTVTVTPVAEGTATITVTAPAEGDYGKRTRTVKVTVGEESGGSSETNLIITETGTLKYYWQDTEYTITGPASALAVDATLSFEIEGNGHNHQADCYTADNQGGTQLINNGNSVKLTQAMIDAISVSDGTFTIYAITWGGETLKSATITP